MAQPALKLVGTDGTAKPAKPGSKFRFTKTKLKKIPTPSTGESWHHDSDTPGLSLLARPSGTRTFFFVGRFDGRERRKAIGKFPAVGIESARKAAAAAAGKIAQGINPFEKKRTDKATVGELVDAWLDHAQQHKRSASEDRRRAGKHLKSWKSKRAATVTRADVVKLHRQIGSKAPVEANRTLALIKSAWNQAIDAGLAEANPVTRIKPYDEPRRARYMDADELPRFLQALDNEPSRDARDILLVLLLTAQRRGNVLPMRWADVDLSRRVWTIARTKAGHEHVVPLVAELVVMLERRGERAEKGAEFVFPARSKAGHFTDPMPALKRVCERAEITARTTPHDLRRTWATWAGKVGVDSMAIKKALDHSTKGDITAGYVQIELGTLRAAFEKTAAAILATRETTTD